MVSVMGLIPHIHDSIQLVTNQMYMIKDDKGGYQSQGWKVSDNKLCADTHTYPPFTQ